MNINYNILSIDGLVGVGKTSQINMLRMYLAQKNIDYKIFRFKSVDSVEYTQKQLLSILNYLEENPNSMAICDGSIATDIVDDIAIKKSKDFIYKKHAENLRVYKSINVKYKTLNILLSPQNIEFCKQRLEKRERIYSEKNTNLDNDVLLSKKKQIFDSFDYNMFSTNIKFTNIPVFQNESILEVFDKIKKIL